MMKIIAISCIIVAVSLNFQEVEGLNVPNPLSRVANSDDQDVSSISSLIRAIERLIKIVRALDGAVTDCVRAYKDGHTIVQEVTPVIKACLKRNSTNTTDSDLENKLTNLIDDVQRTLESHDSLQAIQSLLPSIPTHLVDALGINDELSEMLKFSSINWDQLKKLIKKLIHVAVQCEKDIVQHVSAQQVDGFLSDLEGCIKSLHHL